VSLTGPDGAVLGVEDVTTSPAAAALPRVVGGR
jgi:hypothetical protein